MATTAKTIVLITGANGGIGFELAAQLMAKGSYHVLLGSRSVEKGQTAVTTLQSKNLPGSVELITLDVTSDDSIDKAVMVVGDHHGRLDVLVNNAGIAGWGTSLRQQMRSSFDTNTTGPTVLTLAFEPLLKRSENPLRRIVNISSGAGSIDYRLNPSGTLYNHQAYQYRASKAALSMITACQWVAYEPLGIKVFAYAPGFTESNLGPMNTVEKGAKPVAEAVVPLVDLVEGRRDDDAGKFLHSEGVYACFTTNNLTLSRYWLPAPSNPKASEALTSSPPPSPQSFTDQVLVIRTTVNMLARRLLYRFPSSTFRTLSTTPAYQRAPSLADIEPNGAPTFDAHQRAFREGTKEAQRAKEKQDSQSIKTSSSSSAIASGGSGGGVVPTAHDTSNANSSSASSSSFTQEVGNSHVVQALGSLSTNPPEAAREASNKQDSSKRKGALSSLIYGTHEGQQMDQEIEKSFSQVLARGKYVHSIVLHSVKPDKVDEYVELVGGWYPKMAKIEDNHVHLGYHASLHSIASHPDFPAFDRKLKSLITHKQTSLMQEFSFWPTSPPRQLGGLFELRSYTLHPGNLLEWETHWRKGLAARREVMEGVGAWFVQIGDLNTVHHLWQFANLEERRARREMSWGIEGWGDTVHKTVPLIQTMKSRVLVAMPWSPVA
ncbi:MAG: hypothetical protein Q9220_005183 [cf. Caloplaca sp. 1 TL-2023]